MDEWKKLNDVKLYFRMRLIAFEFSNTQKRPFYNKKATKAFKKYVKEIKKDNELLEWIILMENKK